MISKVLEIQVKQKYKEKHSTWECVHDCLRRKKNHHRQHSLYIYKQFMCQILAIYVPYVPSRAMRCVLNEVKWWWPEKMSMEKKGERGSGNWQQSAEWMGTLDGGWGRVAVTGFLLFSQNFLLLLSPVLHVLFYMHGVVRYFRVRLAIVRRVFIWIISKCL